MSAIDPNSTTVHQIVQQHQADPDSIKSTLKAYFSRVEKFNPTLNLVAHNGIEQANTQAEQVAEHLKKGIKIPLAGVPVLVKDNICTHDFPTTCASNILGSYTPPYDATVIARLRSAGAIVTGKVNMDEFGMGSSNENTRFGPAHNPWRKGHVPGGSSGGSAAAVAAGMAPVALGSDTGGSVRQPAGFCGVYGYKPTYGRLSRYGLVAFGSSLDQIGILAHHPDDCRAFAEVASGFDPRDSTSRHQSSLKDEVSQRSVDWAKVKVGVVQNAFSHGLQPAVQEKCESAIGAMTAAGATRVDIDLDFLEYLVSIYYVIATAEASANLLRFDGIRYGHRDTSGRNLQELYEGTRSQFGPEVKRRILLGTFVLSSGYYDSYYGKAKKAQAYIAKQFDHAFRDCDVMVMPTSPTTAFPLGAKTDDPLAMYLSDIFTILSNLTQTPAVSVPCGFDGDNLPVGLQLLGPVGGDSQLLSIAKAYSELQCYDALRRPPL